MRPVLAFAAAACLAALPGVSAPAPTSLSVWGSGAWQTWWRSDRAPDRWTAGDPRVLGALRWSALAPGLEWATLRVGGPGPAWRTRLIVARIDPRRIRLSLTMDVSRERGRPAWTIDQSPGDALLTVNAGQFVGGMPWGWVVVDGVERLSRGRGPLSSAVTVDGAGRVRWFHGDAFTAPAGVVTAFQSYPTLLAGDGVVPKALAGRGGVSLTHRDARLALGQTRDGRLLVVMTRFDAIGEVADRVPLGPTTPEMAAILGALGASDAVMLDGGISAQLLLHDTEQHAHRWPGLRKVPLALVARARPETAARTR